MYTWTWLNAGTANADAARALHNNVAFNWFSILSTLNLDASGGGRDKKMHSTETLHMVPKATAKGKRSFTRIGAYC